MRTRISAAIVSASIAFLVGGRSFGFNASTVEGAIKASNAFGFDLYLQARRGQLNFVFSPAGATAALTMTAAGAHGKTRAEMLHALHIDPENFDQTYAAFAAILTALKGHDGNDGLSLNVATHLWVRKNLEPRPIFLSLLHDVFHVPLSEVSFDRRGEGAVAAINQWASDETHGRARQVIARLSGADTVVLTNVASMTGAWGLPFEERATYDAEFTAPLQRTAVKVKMMKRLGRFRYSQVDGAKVIELFYQGELSMIVVLPDGSDDLEKIENRLGDRFDEWVEALEQRDVDVELPRFATTTVLPLANLLKAVTQANFPEMASDSFAQADRQNPPIGRAVQTASIETPAPINTPSRRVKLSGDPILYVEPVRSLERRSAFHANHPFMYIVRDVRSGQIIFMGRIVNPANR